MQAVDHGAQEFVVRGSSAGDQLMAVIRQAIARKRAETRLVTLALRDSLTGLANRTLLGERLERAKLRAGRERQPFAVLFVDLDGFKHVNDSLGHELGDHLLQGVARRLEAVIRGVDTVARFGGDEFVLVVEGLKHAHDGRIVAQKTLKAVLAPFELAGHQLHVGASIGISVYPDDTTDLEALIRLADAAMYDAKRSGRNRIVCHAQPETPEDERERDHRQPAAATTAAYA
jgi:diguanylate cyclase (GGDEF)-like protein